MSHQAQTSGSFSNNCCRSEQIFQVIDSKAGQARSSTGLVLAWTEYLFCLAPLKGAAAEHQLISSLVSLSIVKICKKNYTNCLVLEKGLNLCTFSGANSQLTYL